MNTDDRTCPDCADLRARLAAAESDLASATALYGEARARAEAAAAAARELEVALQGVLSGVPELDGRQHAEWPR